MTLAYSPDIAAVGPALELTIRCTSQAPSLRCAGTLDERTRHHVLDALDELLRVSPLAVLIDVADLCVPDTGGADALIEVRRRARAAGVVVRWQGLDATDWPQLA